MLKVVVSPHYHGNGWYDPKAKMNFFKRDGVITIPDGTDLTNINRYIRLNYLVVVEDEIKEKKDDLPQLVTSTPGQLLSGKETGQEQAKIQVATKPKESNEETQKEKREAVEAKAEQKVKDKKPTKKKGKVACRYCGKLYSVRGIASHEKSCKKNPDNK